MDLGAVLGSVGLRIVPRFIVFGPITGIDGLVAITSALRFVSITGVDDVRVGLVGFFLVKVDFSFVGKNGLPRSAQLVGFFLSSELLKAVGPDELDAGPQVFFEVFDREFLDHGQSAFRIACVSLGAGGH